MTTFDHHKDQRQCQFTDQHKRNRRRRQYKGHRRRSGRRRRRRKSNAVSYLSDTCCRVHDDCLHGCDCQSHCNTPPCGCTGTGFCLCYSACDLVLSGCAQTPGHCLCDLRCRAMSFTVQHTMILAAGARCVIQAGEAIR